ncbi:hypothetical protein [Streptomyces syringium]|uniref:hypothetical protein n=1 Tax=Streptomyces syringium TaxID=76729 RepID=UPI0037CE4A0D
MATIADVMDECKDAENKKWLEQQSDEVKKKVVVAFQSLQAVTFRGGSGNDVLGSVFEGDGDKAVQQFRNPKVL